MTRKQGKELLEQSLNKLLKDAPLEKIDIRDIAENAGLSRQTFYYNFRNKRDMIDWICDKNNNKAAEAFAKNGDFRCYVMRLLITVEDNRRFYQSLLLNKDPDFAMGAFESSIIRWVSELERKDGRRMSGSQWDSLQFYVCAMAGLTAAWLTGELRADLRQLANILMDNMPPALKEYIQGAGGRKITAPAAESCK